MMDKHDGQTDGCDGRRRDGDVMDNQSDGFIGAQPITGEKFSSAKKYILFELLPFFKVQTFVRTFLRKWKPYFAPLT